MYILSVCDADLRYIFIYLLLILLLERLVLSAVIWWFVGRYTSSNRNRMLWAGLAFLSGLAAFLPLIPFVIHVKNNGPSRENFLPFDPGKISSMILIFLFSQFFTAMGAALLGILIMLSAEGSPITGDMGMFDMLNFLFSTDVITMLIIIPDLAIILLLLVTLEFSGHLKIPPFNLKLLIFGFLVGIATYVAFIPIDILMRTLIPSPGFFNLDSTVSLISDTQIGLFLLGACVFAPTYEEMFFRAYIFDNVKRNVSRKAAFTVSTLFFALAHMNIVGFVSILLAGLALAWFYEKKGLWGSVGLHAGYNFIGTAIMLLVQ